MLTTDMNRLASTKHPAANPPAADTLASDTNKPNSRIEQSDTDSLRSPTDYEKPTKELDTNVYHYTQLPRRKSIHKRIGRIFLRISRMCSGNQCSAYAYQYGDGASELPAGGQTTEGTTSFYEMPGSFPQVELEGHNMQKLPISSFPVSIQNSQAAPEHLPHYYKANQNATLRRAAPMSVASLSQLPRLEVPQSQQCVPQLISDHSPFTPSPVSPMTPGGDVKYTQRQPSRSHMYLDTISPCTIPNQGQKFAHYGSRGRSGLSPTTPSTASSFEPSYTTTPQSAYQSSAQSPFQAWPQSQPGLLLPTYSQEYGLMQYSHSMESTTSNRPSLWQNNFQYQVQDYHSDLTARTQAHELPLQAQSCFEKQSQLDTSQAYHTCPQTSHAFDEAPPAYSPVVPDPLPVTIQPITTNTQQRYPPSVCQQCGKVFTGKYGPGNCKRHVQQVHASIFDKAIHMCKVCMKTYNRADALRKHQWKKHRIEDSRPNKRREKVV